MSPFGTPLWTVRSLRTVPTGSPICCPYSDESALTDICRRMKIFVTLSGQTTSFFGMKQIPTKASGPKKQWV